MIESQRFKHIKGGVPPQFKRQYNMLVDTVNKMQRSLFTTGFMDSTGFLTRRPSVSNRNDSKIFEVYAAGTGDGVYGCHEQTLDATEWDDTAGDDRFDNKDSVVVEVLNLFEAHCAPNYHRGLTQNDRLKAWKMTDDEGTSRWVGMPIIGGNPVYLAQTGEDAPAQNYIEATILDESGNESTQIGVAQTIYCIIAPNTTTTSTVKLNAAIPRLVNNQYIFVTNIRGKWWCNTIFQASTDC